MSRDLVYQHLMLQHSARVFDVEHFSKQPPSQSTEEPTELEIRQLQKPTEPRKEGYGESFIITMGWLILWLIKNAILLLIILLLLEYVIGPILTHFIFSGCWETLPGADCS